MIRRGTKGRLWRVGEDLRSRYYLLKYSLSFHAKRLGINLDWSDRDITVMIRFNGRGFAIAARDNRFVLGPLREVFGEEPYDSRTLIPGASTVVDLGANIGAYSIYASALYPDARIVAVEPDQGNFDILQKNIDINSLNVTAVRAAICGSPDVSIVRLYDSASNTAFSTTRSADTRDSWTDVPAITLGDLLDNHGLEHVDLLKCDIEGAETELFRNLDDSTRDRLNCVLLEYHSDEALRVVRDSLGGQFELCERPGFRRGTAGIVKFRRHAVAQS